MNNSSTVFSIIVSTTVFLGFGSSAIACSPTIHTPLDLRRVLSADIVVSGSIKNYDHDDGTGPGGSSRYDVIDFSVSRSLKGNAPPSLSFAWNHLDFGEPFEWNRNRNVPREPGDVVSNSYVVVLQGTLPLVRPLMRGSGERQPAQDPDALTVLSYPCAGAYFFRTDSEIARAIEFLFADDVGRENEAEVLARYLLMDGSSH